MEDEIREAEEIKPEFADELLHAAGDKLWQAHRAQDEGTIKVKKWEHLAIRPSTFIIFREYKEIDKSASDNEFMLKLLEAYRLSLLKEKGELK